MAKQVKQPEGETPKVNGCVNGSTWILPKGQRMYYWVEITKVLTVRGQDDDPTVNVTHQCFVTKKDYDMFLANSEKIGMKRNKLVWNPEIYK